MLEKDKILENLSWLVKLKKAPYVLVSLYRSHHCVTKFANFRITQNLEDDDRAIYIKVIDGEHTGVTATNSLHRDNLERALDDAMTIARLSPESAQKAVAPKATKAPGKKQEKLQTYFSRTANFTLEKRDEAVAKIFGDAKKAGLDAAGTLVTGVEEMAVADSSGRISYQPFTISSVKVIATRDGQSGFASSVSRDVDNLQVDGVTNRAIQKALLNKSQKEIEPGKYDCILEPEAVAEILDWLSYIGFGAKRFAEHTSFVSGRIEQKIMGDNVTIYDDALDPAGLASPFDFEGMPRRKVMLIDRGVAKGVVFDSEYGNLYKKDSTGHALTPDSIEGPLPLNLAMKQGDATTDEMISSLKKGILITRFHYVNGFLDPREALMTGLTRDGTFLIQNGKIKCALKNLRFTESILDAFKRIGIISKERMLVGDPASEIGASLVPAILVRNFTFTGKAG